MWKLFGNKERFEAKDTTERIERIEKSLRRMEEEWSEVYGKFRTLQMRVAKQVQRLEQAEAEEVQANEAGEAEVISSGVPSTLSPRARTIQRQILERRTRLQGGGTE